MITASMENRALLVASRDAKAPASATMAAVARAHGLNRIAQMRQMIALRFGPGKIAQAEYYAYRLFDSNLTLGQKREYVGRIGSWKINDHMNPATLTRARLFVADKVMYTSLLRQLGLPTTETQGVASRTRHFGRIPGLRDPADLRKFLTDQARFPLFAKPCEGQGSVGPAMLVQIVDGQIILGNGRRANLEAFCAEVFADYPEGFIFQTALRQHKILSDVAGAAIGTIRVVTVRDTDQPRVLYSIWKIPAPDAMSNNFWQSGSMLAQVNAHGLVGKCWAGTGLSGRFVETHPVSGARFSGLQIPHWQRIQQVAGQAHALFPDFGVIGWDIAVTRNGPVIIKANDNPNHALWQMPEGRGIRNADFMAVFDKTAEKSRTIFQGKIDMFKIRQRAKGRRA